MEEKVVVIKVALEMKKIGIEALLKCVNSNKEGHKMENHFEDEGSELD